MGRFSRFSGGLRRFQGILGVLQGIVGLRRNSQEVSERFGRFLGHFWGLKRASEVSGNTKERFRGVLGGLKDSWGLARCYRAFEAISGDFRSFQMWFWRIQGIPRFS